MSLFVAFRKEWLELIRSYRLADCGYRVGFLWIDLTITGQIHSRAYDAHSYRWNYDPDATPDGDGCHWPVYKEYGTIWHYPGIVAHHGQPLHKRRTRAQLP